MAKPIEIQQQMQITSNGSRGAENKLVVGSQARILYADAEGRMKIRSF
jgi:urocanate hydratase